MHNEHEHAEHIVSPLVYVGVYIALLAGLGLTIFASYLNLGIFNPIIVLVIAFAQATIAAFFSMHLKYGSKLNQLSVGASIFIFLILVVMVLLDYGSRAWGSW